MATVRFTRQEVEARNQRNNAAIIINNVVYDVSLFLDHHPGGVDVLLHNAGKDVTECFLAVGHSEIAVDWRELFVVGEVVDEERWPVLTRDMGALQVVDYLSMGLLLSVYAPIVLAAFATVLFMHLFL